MKLILAILIVFGAAATSAQTNGQIITFTNNAGRVFENVQLRKIERDGIIWFATNGLVGGKVKFTELSPATRERFGYDPLAEHDAIKQEAERKEAVRKLNLATQQTALEQKRLEELRAKREAVAGKVLQRVADGLLIINHESDWGTETRKLFPEARGGSISIAIFDKTEKPVRGKRREYPMHMGTCLLINHPSEQQMADGTKIEPPLLVYPAGVYEYTTVQGAKATVRKFSYTPVP